ncbi:hypothetical protein FRC00_001530, partial [Tulasnella sp. 408]
YLSNPTEASFRTFVTELAFRRHITKLSGGQLAGDDTTTDDANTSSGSSPSRGGRRQVGASSTPTSVTPTGPGFHFSNRANISLRTPAHVFRSFLFFTIVIVTPVSNSKPSTSDAHPGKDRSGGKPVSSAATLEGSWYIGAFGQWWLAGTLEFPKTLSRKPLSAKEQLLGDEAAISPFDQKGGVLSMKSLDRGAPLRNAVSSTPLVKLSPVKPAAAATNGKVKRRRSVAKKPQGCNNNGSDDEGIPIRSTTPPPLPQSASLPLHSTRLPPTQATQHPLPCATRTAGVERVRLTPSKPTSSSYSHGTAPSSQSPASPQHSLRKSTSQHLANLDQHPAVVEVLNQIKAAESHLSDLQCQFTSFTTTASAQRQNLQQTLHESREKKIQDDKTRAESKSRLKSLEDSRQTAELSKRGVEKRLKGVQNQYDLALHRIEQLEEEIQELQKAMAEDESRVIQSGIEASETEAEMGRKIAAKKKELALAEELVTKLEARVQELESSIDEAKVKLAKAKVDADDKQKSRVSLLLQQRSSAARSRPSSGQFGPASGSSNDLMLPASIVPHPQRSSGQFAFPPANLPGPPPHARQHSSTQSSILQRRRIPSAAEPEPLQIAKPGPTAGPSPDDPPVTAKSMRPRAASLSGNTTVIVDTTGIPGFAAIGARNVSGVTPSSGIGVIGRGPPPRIASQHSFERYPSSAAPPPMETVDEDKASKYRRWFPYFINSQAGGIAVFPRTNEFAAVQSSSASTKSSKSKSGLNPDAKVFTFSRSRNSLHVNPPPANTDPAKAGETGDAESGPPTDIQPNTAQIPHPSFASRMYGSLGFNHRPTTQPQGSHEDATTSGTPTGNFFSSLLAFAPSPAERRALQRGLEKSKDVVNGSLGSKGSASREVLPISPFASPLPSAQSSAVDLHHTPSAASAPWDREIQVKAPNSSEVSQPKSSPVEKRTFSSLWLRNKAARASNASLTGAEATEKDKDSKAPDNKALDTVTGIPSDIENPVFGGRFRFTRQKSVTQENSVTSKE